MGKQKRNATAQAASRPNVRKAARMPEPTPPAETTIKPLHMLILGVVTSTTAVALLLHGTSAPNILFVVLAVVGVGAGTVALYRTLWPLVSEDGLAEPEMVGGRTRAALEREKTIVLRAIKELEFDRAMGKVSEADCDEMIGRLRARAVRLIKQLDAGSAGYRDLIEREIQARLGAAPPFDAVK